MATCAPICRHGYFAADLAGNAQLQYLLAQLSSGRVTAVDATRAFLRRAGIAQKLVNCVFEVVPEEALQRAEELDAFYRRHERVVGPLHGLPVSLKAMIPWRGLKSTGGIVANLETTCEEDASLVTILRSLGAIPFVRTYEPQGAMMLENLGPIHGSTLNPHNTHLTPGGSTGGEGALMGLLASPLGLGTDIGGSVRSPAANCGVYALRPSCFRLPATGIRPFFLGMETILGTPGPMSPSRHGISIFMKSILDTRPWETDPSILPIPWRTVEEPTTLNIGVIWDDGVVKPSRAMIRAMQEVVAKLSQNPLFKVTEWKPFKHDEAMEILVSLAVNAGA